MKILAIIPVAFLTIGITSAAMAPAFAEASSFAKASEDRSADRQNEARSSKLYVWKPITTWIKDAVTLVVTGTYLPYKEADEDRPRPKTSNQWFW